MAAQVIPLKSGLKKSQSRRLRVSLKRYEAAQRHRLQYVAEFVQELDTAALR